MIIPAYNEEESIFDTVTSILNYRKKVDFDLDYVILVMNLGIGCAVQMGYKYALEHDYDVAV